MPVDAVRDSSPGSKEPPKLIHVSFDVVPGHDIDRINQVIEALDEAYAALREALLHQRSGVGAGVVREFWRGNFGQAFKVSAAVSVIEPE